MHIELGDVGTQRVGGGLGALPSDAVTCELCCSHASLGDTMGGSPFQ